jgi:hypothetical protein
VKRKLDVKKNEKWKKREEFSFRYESNRVQKVKFVSQQRMIVIYGLKYSG